MQYLQKAKQFARECIRVLKILKKPTSDEFKSTVKVSALGIGIIGFLGFMFVLLRELIVAGI